MHTTRKSRAALVGTHRLEKFRRGESQPYEVQETHNAVTKSLFLDLGRGASSDHVTSASDLRIKDSGGTVRATLAAMAAGYPSHATPGQMVAKWEDNSTNTYPAHTLEIVTPGGAVFSTSAPNFGTKPANENWHYTYTLTFGAGTSWLTEEGVDLWLKLVTGTSNSHFDATTKLRVFDNWGDPELPPTGEIEPVGGIVAQSVTRIDADTVRWSFKAPNGVFEGNWVQVIIENAGGTTAPWWLTRRRSTAGLKEVRIERTYHYEMSV